MTSLLISPHNDDAELFASFLCLRHQPHVVVCLRSFRMNEASYPHQREFGMTFQKREEETDEAMRVLGCSWEQWTIPDNTSEGKLESDLAAGMEQLAKREWEHVFAPAVELGGQVHHNLVGEIAGRFFPKATYYLTYTPNGRTRDGEEVPFEPDWPAIKLRALACYLSQIRHPATNKHFLDGGLREYVAR